LLNNKAALSRPHAHIDSKTFLPFGKKTCLMELTKLRDQPASPHSINNHANNCKYGHDATYRLPDYANG